MLQNVLDSIPVKYSINIVFVFFTALILILIKDFTNSLKVQDEKLHLDFVGTFPETPKSDFSFTSYFSIKLTDFKHLINDCSCFCFCSAPRRKVVTSVARWIASKATVSMCY